MQHTSTRSGVTSQSKQQRHAAAVIAGIAGRSTTCMLPRPKTARWLLGRLRQHRLFGRLRQQAFELQRIQERIRVGSPRDPPTRVCQVAAVAQDEVALQPQVASCHSLRQRHSRDSSCYAPRNAACQPPIPSRQLGTGAAGAPAQRGHSTHRGAGVVGLDAADCDDAVVALLFSLRHQELQLAHLHTVRIWSMKMLLHARRGPSSL